MQSQVTVSPSQLGEVLLNVATVRPVFLWGAPGIGKSSLVRDFAASLALDCVSLLGTQLAPEDLIALKLAAFREDTARQWYDCLAVREAQELDWDYLTRRAARRPHRVLALLIYAAGEGVSVFWPAIDRLLELARAG